MTNNSYGLCQVCEKRYVLRPDGTIAMHGWLDRPGQGEKNTCLGSFRLPLEQETTLAREHVERCLRYAQKLDDEAVAMEDHEGLADVWLEHKDYGWTKTGLLHLEYVRDDDYDLTDDEGLIYGRVQSRDEALIFAKRSCAKRAIALRDAATRTRDRATQKTKRLDGLERTLHTS